MYWLLASLCHSSKFIPPNFIRSLFLLSGDAVKITFDPIQLQRKNALPKLLGRNILKNNKTHSENPISMSPLLLQHNVKCLVCVVFSDESLTAQSFVFLTAGTESVSATLGFVLYHTGKDPRIQKMLQEEVDSVLAKHGKCTYQALKEMTYLDQVIQGENV